MDVKSIAKYFTLIRKSEEETKLKARRKIIINIIMEISPIWNRKIIVKFSEIKSFFEKISTFNKILYMMTKKEKTQIIKISDERGHITTDLIEMKECKRIL